ncbi:hypothetical protein EI77_00233 [Prosthecobacter fusiformis]|uniref:3-keto-disaccharide hydrolase domain-containing protein n=1 Tax=Prosthecobacter fusiformis TaxID=48464 RepID=A0A4R7SPK5_9BACT|nr:hypothetical protein [Prosthecobacter fusiformis]TDU80931.1 hypothetical protein EI77_00233 [Prosthecobacter fusiformis]
MKFLPLLCLAFPLFSAAADIPTTPLAEKGDSLFNDDFERSILGEWKSIIPTFTVEGGVLKGVQTRDDHGAVGRVYRPMKDVIIEFKFQLAGSATFNAVFDDQKHKGSHAGHITRITFTPKLIRLGDDKEGLMRNDIYLMRKDPAQKPASEKLLVGRGSSSPVVIEQKKWYHVTIENVGDKLRILLDGKPTAFLQSSGLAHETKSSFHFTVTGPGVLFDDVRIWNAK